MDKETGKALSEAEKVEHLVKSDGWEIIKKRLLSKMAEYGGIMNIEETDPVKLLQLIGANQQAIKIIVEWFREIDNSIDLAKEFKSSIEDDLNKLVITSNED